jgi:putative membrane protein
MTTEATKSTNELAEDRTDLALRRTLMGADRTLMAWVRTALSMISFGFTIYKVLQGFQETEDRALVEQLEPRNVGLFLTALGTISMVLGTIEYWQTLKELRLLAPIPLWRPSFIMAMIISVVGLLVFLSIIAKLL